MREPVPYGTVLATPRGERFLAFVGRPRGSAWTSPSALFGPDLAEALASTAQTRGSCSAAAAGSLLLEQYAVRVLPPVLAAWFEEGRRVEPAWRSVSVERHNGRVTAVAFADVADSGVSPIGAWMSDHLEPAVAAVERASGVGLRVLRGGIAHAVAVSFLHLSWPKHDPAHHLANAVAVLREWGLEDLVTLDAPEVGGRRWLYAERRSCCLAFRTDHHLAADVPYCATCPVVPEEVRRRSFSEGVAAFRQRHGS